MKQVPGAWDALPETSGLLGLLPGSDRWIGPFGMRKLAGIAGVFYWSFRAGDGMSYCLKFSTELWLDGWAADLTGLE
jgi:hypothetical protein